MSHLSIWISTNYSALDIYDFIKKEGLPWLSLDLFWWYSPNPYLNIENTCMFIQQPSLGWDWLVSFFILWDDYYARKPDIFQKHLQERVEKYEKTWEKEKAEKIQSFDWLSYEDQKKLWWKLKKKFWRDDNQREELIKDLDWNMVNISELHKKHEKLNEWKWFSVDLYAWKDVMRKIEN